MNVSDVTPRFTDIVIVGNQLPNFVFMKSFKKYFFFDADISTSIPLIDTVIKIVLYNKYDSNVDVYASHNGKYLTHLSDNIDWRIELKKQNDVIIKEVGYSGLTLIDPKLRWVVYQYFPAELGVLAIDSHLDFSSLPGVEDSFFTCQDLRNWRSQKTQEDIVKLKAIGAEVAAWMINNYCS